MSSSIDIAFIDFRRKNNMALKKQDDFQNGRQTDPHGTIFRNGNIKIRILETLRVTKIYISVTNKKSHITAHVQKVPE